MKFWDSSALVPLMVEETSTAFLFDLFHADMDMLAWWGAEVECVSALARLEREGRFSTAALAAALKRMKELRGVWHEVQPTESVRDTAIRLLRVHSLRVTDSLQLAAAIVASENKPATLDFVCLDAKLALAAQREGFNTITI